jgi:hypothetical protein
MEDDLAGILKEVGQNQIGVIGSWVTVVLFFLRNEFNHRKLRNDNDNVVRTSLLTRIEKLEAQNASERLACQLETKALRDELASINQRFVQFQLAVVREMTPTNANGALLHAMHNLANQEESSNG